MNTEVFSGSPCAMAKAPLNTQAVDMNMTLLFYKHFLYTVT